MPPSTPALLETHDTGLNTDPALATYQILSTLKRQILCNCNHKICLMKRSANIKDFWTVHKYTEISGRICSTETYLFLYNHNLLQTQNMIKNTDDNCPLTKEFPDKATCTARGTSALQDRFLFQRNSVNDKENTS